MPIMSDALILAKAPLEEYNSYAKSYSVGCQRNWTVLQCLQPNKVTGPVLRCCAQDARLSKFEADFKQQQSKMTNKIDTFLKAINDRMTGALPSDMVKNSKLNVNLISSVSSARSYPMEDPHSSS
ncbi:hypothetical protein Tco_1002653 [Tanacetum coccineum]|uniref:Uncharacterized protein n=1 Tax=Tanacetum coccineum TaxID=301880 RepID=A0ABQ5F766_9ASTR